ncbi:thiosulfate sulfurtransferase GlpE [Pragia fontium]|uniref:Thiosulfate sulfurtransferase GlpE n=2 Tax=Pragia fontium TaxID=82985 RepID=A0AAJ4WCD7_9GAMM|nr:thiosulfate sulfurtransferase GlpE [Pragia fontium]AKJ40874.1 thiosulfate sulfurtransferase [Pragia fontium]GKX64403.1 thiosulfate sulfurtransferase GlpE [Pragia fontium]SFD18715.1 thiosulfate sulfurtransferase [Pragia fontium DSM 5563 = ATCC 49100]VEJ52966.1 Thiosulfate sulfurtransferase glpE [Pragia fontium]
MEQFGTISIDDAFKRLQQGEVSLVDIRDAHSFQSGHVPEAIHLTDSTLNGFMQQTDFSHPILVMCYHGISSRGAAQYLVNQGFEEVYSVEGGFESWQRHYPQNIITS